MNENFNKDRDGFLKINPNLDTDDELENFQKKSSVIFPYINDGDIFEQSQDDLISAEQDPKTYVERENAVNDIQLEKFENESDISMLYKMAESPIDFDNFMYRFEEDPEDGINLYKIGLFENFDMRKETLLGLLDSKASSMKWVNEYIEPHVDEFI